MEKVRLNKVLQRAGICSRRKSDALIAAGKISVNGEVVAELGTMVDPIKDAIKVDNKLLAREESKITYIVNKPSGYICSNRRTGPEPLAIDLIPKTRKHMFTVGRLDKDATGLLIITNDGDFANKVIHPSSNISKEYHVKVGEKIHHHHIKKIKQGVSIEGVHVVPHQVTPIRNKLISIVLKDGKKHEVKKLIKQAGLPLLELKRIRIGNLHLGKLSEGKHRLVDTSMKEMIFE